MKLNHVNGWCCDIEDDNNAVVKGDSVVSHKVPAPPDRWEVRWALPWPGWAGQILLWLATGSEVRVCELHRYYTRPLSSGSTTWSAVYWAGGTLRYSYPVRAEWPPLHQPALPQSFICSWSADPVFVNTESPVSQSLATLQPPWTTRWTLLPGVWLPWAMLIRISPAGGQPPCHLRRPHLPPWIFQWEQRLLQHLPIHLFLWLPEF